MSAASGRPGCLARRQRCHRQGPGALGVLVALSWAASGSCARETEARGLLKDLEAVPRSSCEAGERAPGSRPGDVELRAPEDQADPVLERIAALLAEREPAEPPVRAAGARPEPAIPPLDATPPVGEGAPPARAPHLLGPLDELDIAVGGQPEFSGKVVVREDGTLAIPTTGDLVQAAGKTLEELAEAVADALSPRYLKKRPLVSATLRSSPRLVYHVFGAVRRPGRYRMPPEGITVLDAVILASRPAESDSQGSSLGFEPVPGARYERVHVAGPLDGELRIVDVASAMRGGPERRVVVPAGSLVLVPASSGPWEETEIRKRLQGEASGDRGLRGELPAGGVR